MGASDPVSAESSRAASSTNGTEECRESVDVEECVIRETVDIEEWYSRDRRRALSGIRETVDVEECHSETVDVRFHQISLFFSLSC